MHVRQVFSDLIRATLFPAPYALTSLEYLSLLPRLLFPAYCDVLDVCASMGRVVLYFSASSFMLFLLDRGDEKRWSLRRRVIFGQFWALAFLVTTWHACNTTPHLSPLMTMFDVPPELYRTLIYSMCLVFPFAYLEKLYCEKRLHTESMFLFDLR